VLTVGELKKKLREGEVALGTWISINHPDVVDALSELPFDWFVFDMEHAPLEVSDLEVLAMPLKGSKVTPIARVPWNDMVTIKRVLDVGVEGVLVPWVNSKEEAEAAIAAVSYHPKGIRGVGPRRCIRFGKRPFLDYYERFEREELVLIVQVETEKALKNLDEILSVEGIEVAYVGPMDLTVNLGIPAQFDHPKFRDALQKIKDGCNEHDITPGIHTFSSKMAEEMIKEGFRFIGLMSDIEVLAASYKDLLGSLRKQK